MRENTLMAVNISYSREFMRVLGIDIGLKRTGLAISDETGMAIRYLPNPQANSRALLIEKILSIVNELNVAVIVIGAPEQKTTGSIAIASRATGLKAALDETFASLSLNVTTHICNEAETSKRAMANLVASDVPQKKRKNLLDAASAAVLIEDFLQAQGKKV